MVFFLIGERVFVLIKTYLLLKVFSYAGNVKWIKSENGEVPPRAVMGGIAKVPRTEPLYIGRANHNGDILPGKVKHSDNALFAF